jgi:hypothetical protein
MVVAIAFIVAFGMMFSADGRAIVHNRKAD